MKNKIRKHFTQVPNHLINNPEISRDARFLFVYLCSKPDDWTFHNSKIEKDLGFSKNTRKKYFKELVDNGWITVTQTKKETGEWGSNEIELNYTSAGTFTPEITAAQNLVDQKHGGPKIGPHNNTNINTNTYSNNNRPFDADFYKSEIADSSHQMWRENFYMKFKLKQGALSQLLDNFNIHLGLKDQSELPKNLKDYKDHFYNWCNVQDRLGKIDEYKKGKKQGAL